MSARAIENPTQLETVIGTQSNFSLHLKSRFAAWTKHIADLYVLIEQRFARLVEIGDVELVRESFYYCDTVINNAIPALRIMSPLKDLVIVEHDCFLPNSEITQGKLRLRYYGLCLGRFIYTREFGTHDWGWFYSFENSETILKVTPEAIDEIFSVVHNHAQFHNDSFRIWLQDQEKAKL